ncbi:GGDEF domain-containing protein, partial [Aquamicrobium sp.]
HLRSMDALSRFGGDEFMLLLPHASIVDAERICTRLRNSLRRTPLRLEDGTTLMISVSCGIAAADSFETFSDLSKRADAALYDAKYAGRGTHRTAPEDRAQRRVRVG